MTDGHTYRRTDHATVTSVAIGGIAFSDNQGNVYGAVLVVEPLRKFTWFT